ncbi:MAG: DUF5615 family PIN-like protein [Anaerolineae bacterium]
MMDKISFYFDEHMPRAVEKALGQRGIVVIMAVDVSMTDKDDDKEHLPFATAHNAVMVSHDHAFAGRASKRSDHAGLICWTGKLNDFGGLIRELSQFVEQFTPEDVKGRVFWLK